MFKLVFVFGLIVASTAGEDTSHSKLSRYAEVSKRSNQTNQTIKESFENPTIDSLKTKQQKRPNPHDQTTQAGKNDIIWFLKWSLTNHSCPHSSERPVKQSKAPWKNEELAMSVSVSVQRKEDGDQNKVEKTVDTSHPKEKREATAPGNDLNLLDDWMENKVKVSHTRHIYIGESLYPYIYEESRVFNSEPPKPSSGEESRLKQVEVSETRHKKEEEVPLYEITKIYEIK